MKIKVKYLANLRTHFPKTCYTVERFEDDP